MPSTFPTHIQPARRAVSRKRFFPSLSSAYFSRFSTSFPFGCLARRQVDQPCDTHTLGLPSIWPDYPYQLIKCVWYGNHRQRSERDAKGISSEREFALFFGKLWEIFFSGFDVIRGKLERRCEGLSVFFQKERIFWLLTVTSRITNLKLLQTLEQSQTCSICSVIPFITPKKGTPKKGIIFFSFSSPQRKGEIKYPPRDRPIAIFKLIWESPKFTPKESQISFTRRFTSLSSSPLRVSPSPKSRKKKKTA